MREIKFRAWNKRIGNMWDVSLKESWETLRDASLVNYAHPGEVVVMQYTGLKDKNGVEIYEGDVIKVTDDNGEVLGTDTGIGSVEWLDNMAGWYVDKVHNGLSDLNDMGYIEVIGNIYEHPELLEEKKG